MKSENFDSFGQRASQSVAQTTIKNLSEGRIAVRLNDNAKTIIFVKPDKNIEQAKEAFLNRPDSYNTFSAKAVEARQREKEKEEKEREKIENEKPIEDWI